MKLQKILVLFMAYGLLLMWDGCSVDDPCNCPEITLEFSDYKDFEIATNNTQIDTNSSRLFEIMLTPDSVHLIAQQCSTSTGLISKAYGCSCATAGFRGDKFPILAIDIFANHPFKDELIAESNVNHLFEMNALDEFGQEVFQIIDNINRFPHVSRFGEPGQLILRTEESPDSTGMNTPYTFEVVVTKSNGAILTMTTGEITWQ